VNDQDVASRNASYADAMSERLASAVERHMVESERTKKALDHRLGVSDLGHCREYMRRMILRMPYTDPQSSMLSAFIGTAVGREVEQAMVEQYAAGLSGEVRVQMEVGVILPSGHALTGHPDIVEVGVSLGDCKTTDGLGVIRRTGPSDQQRFQVHCYAKSLVDAGLLPPDAWVWIAYFDRSGKEAKPYVWAERFSMDVVREADEWLSDVIYAVENDEFASRDKPRSWCEVCCPFYTGCRGTDTDVTGLIEEEAQLAAIALYDDARQREKQARIDKAAAKSMLAGVTGNTPEFTVRWVNKAETVIPESKRAGYSELSIRKRKAVAPKQEEER
jgi:hypothetical protein